MQLESIISSWGTPGVSLIVCDPEKSALFWYHFRAMHAHKVLLFPSAVGDFGQWSGELLQSFLGQSHVFWGSLPAGLPKISKVRQAIFQFLKSYSGPHAVWLLVNEEQAAEFGASCRRIVVSSQISMRELGTYAAKLNFDRSVKVLDACNLSRETSLVSLDEGVQLLLHAGYVPMRLAEQSTAFLSRLLPQDLSLSSLSELFFKKEWELFLVAWNECAATYSDMFWVSFWTEQLWRAYWVCWYMKRGQQTRARSMGYRLPAHFLSSGWQQASLNVLQLQCEKVVFFDAGVKKGSFLSANELVTELVALAAIG